MCFQKGAWETPAAWLDRMNKVVGLFASTVVYPGANPLSLEDGWIWLARVANMCLRYDIHVEIVTIVD